METLQEWLKSKEVEYLRRCSIKQLMEKEFSRNPMRAIFYRPNIFYSPCDGIVLYKKVVDPDKELLSIKGESLTLQDIMCDYSYSEKSLVIGMFLSIYDVHFCRMPTNGFVKIERLPSLYIENLTMTKLENSIIKEGKIDYDTLEYLFTNERWITRIYYPRYNMEYYLVEIADLEVNAIVHYASNGDYLLQGQRLSFVTYGSHVDMIIPYRRNLKVLIPDDNVYHVKAGIDGVVKIED